MNFQLFPEFLNCLQDRPELFVVAFRRLPFSVKSTIDLEKQYSAIASKWIWLLNAEKLTSLNHMSKKQTLSDQRRGGTPMPHHYYSEYLKNVVSLPKRFWYRAIELSRILDETKGFDLEVAQILYESKEAKMILKFLLNRGLIPYLAFDGQYHVYGAKIGMFHHFKYNPKISLKRQMKTFSTLVRSFDSFEYLNTITKGCIIQVLLQVLEKYDGVRSKCGRGLQHFCNLPVDTLSMKDWRRLCFGCHYLPEVISQRTIWETTQFLEGIGVIKNASERTIENIVEVFRMKKRSLECLLREVFNPNITDFNFREHLLTHNANPRDKFPNFHAKKSLDYMIKRSFKEDGETKEYEMSQYIENLIEEGKDERCSWKCLLQAPPGALIKNFRFWMYMNADFFEDISNNPQAKVIFQALQEEESKSALTLLHTIMNNYFDSLRMNFDGKYVINEDYFWSKMLSI